MTNFTALEVVIGLAFVYFVLALVCSAVAETISSLQRRRAKMLVEGIENLFSGSNTITDEGRDLAKLFWSHPLVQALIRPRRGPPSHATPNPQKHAEVSQADGEGPASIPARTFVSALIDLGARNTDLAKQAAADAAKLAGVLSKLKLVDAINGVPSAPLRQALLAIYNEVNVFRRAAEDWYDDAMDRVSGWYKRHIQAMIWIIAVLVALLLNVDTVQIATTLWKYPQRARPSSRARTRRSRRGRARSGSVKRSARSGSRSAGSSSSERVSRTSRTRRASSSPSWSGSRRPQRPSRWSALLVRLASKFVRIRGTGPPPAPTTGADAAAS